MYTYLNKTQSFQKTWIWGLACRLWKPKLINTAGCTLIVFYIVLDQLQNQSIPWWEMHISTASNSLCNSLRLQIQLVFRSFIDLLNHLCFSSIHLWLQRGKETGLTDSKHQSINKGRMWEQTDCVFRIRRAPPLSHAGYTRLVSGASYLEIYIASTMKLHSPPQYADVGNRVYFHHLPLFLLWNVNKVSSCWDMQWRDREGGEWRGKHVEEDVLGFDTWLFLLCWSSEPN